MTPFPLPHCREAWKVVAEIYYNFLLATWLKKLYVICPSGTSIRRHRIPLPPPDDDLFYTVFHFNINTAVVFYGRKFKIYDCDTFTKNFLKKIGIKLNPPEPRPVDPYMKMRREVRIDTSVTSYSETW